MTSDITVLDGAIRKLGRLTKIDAADEAALRALPLRTSKAPAGHDLVHEGESTAEVCLLVEGFACRQKRARDGGRQIVSFHLPGDILGLERLLFDRADDELQTITPARLAWIPIAELRRVALERPAINDAFWRDTLVDSAVFREWCLNIGQRDAKARIAHLLCEFAARYEAAGLGTADRFDLPMSQELIADATGLTSVHVNRMLRELDREGVMIRNQREVRITDRERMCEIADFHPQYLHAA